MNKNYNIPQLFDIAFGIKAYDIYVPEKKKGVQMMSHLGTPIIAPIWFGPEKYQIFDERGNIVSKKFNDFRLPATTLVNFRRAKIITKTKALAANGTVKEMYGFDDWRIDIRGLCLLDPSRKTAQTALEQKKRILDYESVADSIVVFSEIFNGMGIYRITVDEITINQIKGKPEVIPFYLKCSSDEPIELRR